MAMKKIKGEKRFGAKSCGAAGRDHWAACDTVVLAGAGIRSGQIHSASDRMAAFPAERPVTPEDLAAIIYHALGVAGGTELFDALGRPYTLTDGKPLMELWN